MGPDFSGWVTKYGVKCSDGRTIMRDAFAHQDQKKVPLVWKHGHDDSDNVLGHAILTAKPEGVWGDGYFNENPKSQNMKRAVQHDDIDSMSIWANQLAEKTKQVFHGMIREVSLVLAGANSEARITHVNLEHGIDGVELVLAHEEEETDDVVIFSGETIEHGEPDESEESSEDETDEQEQEEGSEDEETDESEEDEEVEHSEGETVLDVLNTMDDKQKNAMAFVLSQTLKKAGLQHSDTEDDEGDLTHQEGNNEMTRNVFEQNSSGTGDFVAKDNVLSHDDMRGIIQGAFKRKQSLKEAVEEYALSHGIEDIDTLFPNFKNIDSTPQFISRRMEWVASVINNVAHSPFSRIRTRFADITHEDARAKGYITGNLKKEEFFSVSKRETSPTTIYKKQKLNRDDILDITDFNAITWVQAEMKVMLQEEIARAILLGDGRPAEDPNNAGEPNPDKVAEPANTAESGAGIRSILNDHELYTITENLDLLDASSSYNEFIDGVTTAMQYYRGSGSPTLYMKLPDLVKIKTVRDTLGRRIYSTTADVAAAMGVGDIQTVEVMEDPAYAGVLGIIVNLSDYTVGTDAGGEVSFFDFFDIDYNQYKYLYETRFTGALTRYRSAIVLRQSGTGSTVHLAEPTSPTFVEETGVVTIPTMAHVVYKDGAGTTLTAGDQTALTDGESLDVVAVPASGYDFPDNIHDQWHYEMPPA